MRKLLSIFLCLYVITICVQTADSLTRAEMRKEVRLLTGDYITTTIGGSTVDTSKVRWQDSDLNLRIEEGHLDVCRKSGLIHRVNYITTVATQTLYNLPSDFLAMEEAAIYLSLTRGTTYYERLLYTDRERLHADDYSWENNNGGQPENYFIEYTSWNIQIGLEPPPNETHTGSRFLRVRYILRIDSMTADTDTPYNEAEHLTSYHKLIIYFVVSWCKNDEGKFADADRYRALYDREVARMTIEVRQSDEYEGGLIAEEYDNTRGGSP